MNDEDLKKKGTIRIGWLDTERTFAVFCIVLGHALRGESVYYLLYSFHVPLCIVITGICYKKVQDRKTRVQKLFKKIYCSYLLYSVLSIAIYALVGSFLGETNPIQQIPKFIVGMLYGNGNLGMPDGGWMKFNLPLWYLPFLFMLELIAGEIYNYAPKSSTKKFFDLVIMVISTIIAGIVYYTIPEWVEFPFGLETVVYLFPFFFLGRNLTFLTEKGKIARKARVELALVFLFIACFMQKTNGSADYVSDVYGNNYFGFVVTAMLFSIGFCFLFSTLPKCKAMEIVGRNTLTILGLHKFPVMFFVTFLIPKTMINNENIYLMLCVICALISILGCMVVSESIYKIRKRCLKG